LRHCGVDLLCGASFAYFDGLFAVFFLPQQFNACAATGWACAPPATGKTS